MNHVTQIEGTITQAEIAGQEITFFVADRNDVIQREQLNGRFYEQEELDIIRRFFPAGGVFVDIGANVGNHSIFVGKYLFPKEVILLEPNPPAIQILKANIYLNGLRGTCNLSHLGVGLSDAAGTARASVPPGNLGGTRLSNTGESNGLPLVAGDDILLNRRVDFLKIDVEGMEMNVLSGLAKTIARWRPSMFIEIENSNVEKFSQWAETHRYQTMETYRRYTQNENYLIAPIESHAAATASADRH